MQYVLCLLHFRVTVKVLFLKRKLTRRQVMWICEITIPLVVQKYNKYMGGVDKSDQYLLYQNVL